MQTSKENPAPRTGPNARVLFDEDYRAHIARLNAKLTRERAEVIKLREENFQLKMALARK